MLDKQIDQSKPNVSWIKYIILIYDEKYIDYHKNDSNLSQCLTHSKYAIHILLNKWINKCRGNSLDNGKEIWKQQEIIMGHYEGGRAALISGQSVAGRYDARRKNGERDKGPWVRALL